MKILRIIARLNVGGPARHVVWLARGLAGEQVQGDVLIAGTVPPGEEDMAYFAVANGVTPIYIPELSRELSPKDLISLFKIYREIRRQRPDIVHTHTAKAGTIGRVAAFAYRWFTWGTLIGRPRAVRVVHTFHGHVFHSYYGKWKTRFFLTIERVLARLATDRIVVISEQQFREIHGDFGVGSEKQFRVIPLGIELDMYEQAGAEKNMLRDECGAGQGDLVVSVIGRLTEIKNIPLALEAAALYQRSEDPDKRGLKLAIIGDGALRADLEALSAALGLGETVCFLGNRQDVAALTCDADVVALTSRNEGTPLSLIEAMAAGKPVIATTVGGVVDLLGEMVETFDGFAVFERGVGVEGDSPEHFTRGLIYLMKNEKLRESLGENGKDFVRGSYSIRRMIHDTNAMYHELF